METQLYFWKPLIEKHKKELAVVEYYYNKTKIKLENIDDEINSYCQNLYDKSCKNNAYNTNEPSSIEDWIYDQWVEVAGTFLLINYNHMLMTISLLYHIWEQQLIKFTLKELEHYFDIDKKALNYEDVQRIFELHGLEIIKTKSWLKIKELKKLVNTIKHGDGDSADTLRKIRPDFFINDNSSYDTLKLHGSVLIDIDTLNVKESDLFEYINATKGFWDEMPERAYSDTDSIIKVLVKNNDKKK